MNGKGFLNIYTEDWIFDDKLEGAVIHIQDKGCGIKMQEIEHIFDPFYTTKVDGTGLGLSISQSLIEKVGGTIKVKSQQGNGSTFSIYLHRHALLGKTVN